MCRWDPSRELFVVSTSWRRKVEVPLIQAIQVIGETLASMMLVGVMVSTPVMRKNYLFSCKVTVGKVDGLLTFGTLAYCFELANKTICSTPKIGYVFDNNEILRIAQNPQTAEIRTRAFSIAIVLAFILATLISISEVVLSLWPMIVTKK